MVGEARLQDSRLNPARSPSPEPSLPEELDFDIKIVTLEELLDVARGIFSDIRVEPILVAKLFEVLRDRVLENPDVMRSWEKRLERDPNTSIARWIADNPLAAREFLRQLVNLLEEAGIRFLLIPVRGGTSYKYCYSINGKIFCNADAKLMGAAARVIGIKGLGFSQETVRKLLQESGIIITEGDLDPPGLLLQSDGTLLDLRDDMPHVLDNVEDAYFESSLNTSLSWRDLETIKSLVETGYSWEGAEDLLLQTYAPSLGKVLSSVFRTSLERAQVREMIGSIFYPGVLRTAFVVVGEAGIGKSVLADSLLYTLGDYAASKPWSVLLGEEGEKHLGGLRGKYANIVSESPKYMIKNVELFKRLTGDEWIEGRLLYHNLFRFRNMCKHIVMCNKIPPFSEVDRSVAERLYIIEASGEPPETPDPEMRGKLRKEAKGILMWVLLNHVYFKLGGFRFQHKPNIERVERLMIAARSNVYAFIEDLFSRGAGGYIAETVKGARVRGKVLREAYVNWCNEVGEEPVGTVKFYEDFAAATREKGVVRSHEASGAALFMNLRLVPIKPTTESHLLAI